LNERREGRHRRSQVRTETGVVRENETRGTRSTPRRMEKLKQRDFVSEQARVNVLNPKLNGIGRRALGRDGGVSSSRPSSSPSKRIVVGVDDGERVENGRSTIYELAAKKKGRLSCVMSSHAPTRLPEIQEQEGVERRVPRKTGVESAQRRGNREGEAVWTTGIGRSPQRSGNSTSEEKRRWDMEVLSDPLSSGEEGGKGVNLQRRRATRGISTIDGTWNERRRPDRYDYYREGHAINRASKSDGNLFVEPRSNQREEKIDFT